MSARPTDAPRLVLEDAMAAVSCAKERVNLVAMRIRSVMLTIREADDAHELALALADLERAQRYMSRCHPQGQKP